LFPTAGDRDGDCVRDGDCGGVREGDCEREEGCEFGDLGDCGVEGAEEVFGDEELDFSIQS
jgi:hypothetical protein